MTQLNCRSLLLEHDFAGLAQALESLVSRREDGFLRLGERLSDIVAASANLSQGAAELAELTSGAGLEESISSLSKELEVMHTLVNQGNDNAAMQGLTTMLEHIREVRTLIPNFKRIVKTLQMLGISTRIESARLEDGGRGFSTLADDVEKLAHAIVDHMADIMSKSDELDDNLKATIHHVHNVLREQEDLANQSFTRIGNNLTTLQEMAANSKELSTQLPLRMQDIGRSVGEVVSSLQFHDIIRQQVEHIGESLAETIAMVEARTEEAGDGMQNDELAAWVSDVCRLQQSQLANAGTTLADAIQHMSHNLSGIAVHVSGLGQDLSQAMDTGDDADNDRLARIERDVSDVAHAMRDYAEQNRQVSGFMQQVASAVAEMGAFVGEIEYVGSEIELLALNASVKAAHTGDEGRALGVLAMAIQHLAGDAREQTSAVSGVLQAIAELSANLNSVSDAGAIESKVDELIASLDASTAEVRQLSQNVGDRFNALAEEGDILAGNISRLAGSIDVHEGLMEELDSASRQLAKVEDELRHHLPDAKNDPGRSERLRTLLSRYTMDAERMVHMSAMGMDTGGMPEAAGSEVPMKESGDEPIGESGDDFGDNIELF